ncbi:acid-sensing ion channel 1-like [Lingula anatina]|uniref:Acid-sensing ion channel 1-like n=1 Tax=Lingula anatina TaxID=7574 RepID=A0A1S3K5Y1_LINAN|nr:acid-sensing ion channel 1-like [Lingula anatina]|eukprot:XP_013417917.1 acid-sensing ion channel 1-like [Lingula anatina]
MVDREEKCQGNRGGVVCSLPKTNRTSPKSELREDNIRIADTTKKETDTAKAAIIAFAQSASVLGLKNAVDPNSSLFRRLLWLCCVLAGTGFLIFHMWNRIIYYSTNPVAVNMEVEYKSSLEFPAVTICNNNVFLNSSLNTSVDRDIAYTYILGGQVKDRLQRIEHVNFSDYNWTEFFKKHSHKAKNMFSFGQDCLWSTRPLSPANFTERVTPIGTCYTFNAGSSPKLSTNFASKYAGLDLLLDAELDEYWPITVEAGFTIMIHEQDDVPVPPLLGIPVAPGGIVDLVLSVKQVENLPPPHGKCQERQLAYFDKFSTVNCIEECFFNLTLKQCSCQVPWGRYHDDVPECSPVELLPCWDVDFETFSIALNRCGCHAPCSETIYEYTMFSSKMADGYKHGLVARHPGTTVEYIDRNLLKLRVFYKSLTVEKITQQEAYSMLALFADIGGALGLVLGSTLMTAVEIVDFCAVLAVRYLLGKKI